MTYRKGLARALRKGATDAEKALWRGLRSHRLEGLQFRRQHPIGPYVVDFVCIEKKLVHCCPRYPGRSSWMGVKPGFECQLGASLQTSPGPKDRHVETRLVSPPRGRGDHRGVGLGRPGRLRATPPSPSPPIRRRGDWAVGPGAALLRNRFWTRMGTSGEMQPEVSANPTPLRVRVSGLRHAYLR